MLYLLWCLVALLDVQILRILSNVLANKKANHDAGRFHGNGGVFREASVTDTSKVRYLWRTAIPEDNHRLHPDVPCEIPLKMILQDYMP